MTKLYPGTKGAVVDVQRVSLSKFGKFDVAHCYGLLYHLESPIAALRNIRQTGASIVILETIICDSFDSIMLLVDEPLSANQALEGLGCRPSPSFVAMALNRVGYRYVYMSTVPPDHEDFQFDWRNDGTASRDGRNLRCIFVASSKSLEAPTLALMT